MIRRIAFARKDDDGVAMVMVIGVASVLATLVVAGIALSMASLRSARNTQDWNAALAAAYAGIEEYQSRLANDTGYHKYGNPASTFSTPVPLTPTHPDNSDVELPTGASANPAFDVGAGGSWATVAGSTGSAQYRYEVDNSKYWSSGVLRLRATGRVGEETRSLVADLKQEGFIDFLYFTDYEVQDPTVANPSSILNCAIRYPNSMPGGCTYIYFAQGDKINGPLHTNDAIKTIGATEFNGDTTTAYDAPGSGPNYYRSSGAPPTFANAGDPVNRGTIGMPATNSQLKKETRSDLPDEVPSPGCLYTGPTSITFNGDGTMTVVSPWTKVTNTTGAADTGGTSPSKCGTPGDTGLARRSGGVYVGQTFAVPTNTVLYVQNVPTATGNVNRTASTTVPPYPASGAPSCPTNGNVLGYPQQNWGGNPSRDEDAPFAQAYGCRNGDVFVKGELEGQVTIAAENYVYITEDITYGTEDSILGLIGNSMVWVWNPYDGGTALFTEDNNGEDPTGRVRTIEAAILSVGHSFQVQNHGLGTSRGYLTVHGAIAQKFRGTVGTGNGTTGYLKNYNYDIRFKYTAPPKFLSPVTTTYGVNVWIEVSPVFDGTGAYR